MVVVGDGGVVSRWLVIAIAVFIVTAAVAVVFLVAVVAVDAGDGMID